MIRRRGVQRTHLTREPKGRAAAGASAASERELVDAAKRGSADAAAQIADEHWASAYRTALLVVGDRQIAEDLAQEAILAALRSLDGFEAGRPLAPWLHRIVTNRAIDWLRSPQSREIPIEGEISRPPGQEPEATDDPDLARALGTLKPDDRALVVLRYALGYRATEIAEMLDIGATAVRSRLHRAMEVLRSELGHREEGR